MKEAGDSHNNTEASDSVNFLDSHDNQDQASAAASGSHKFQDSHDNQDQASTADLGSHKFQDSHDNQDQAPAPASHKKSHTQELIDLWQNYKWGSVNGARGTTSPTIRESGPRGLPRTVTPTRPRCPRSTAGSSAPILEPVTEQSTGQSTEQSTGQSAQSTEQSTAQSTEQSTGQSIGQSAFLEPEAASPAVDADTTKTVADGTAGASNKSKSRNKAHS